MKSKRKLLLGLVFFIGLGLSQVTTALETQINGESVDMLFDLTAPYASVVRCEDKAACDFHVSLSGLGEQPIFWFFDRPYSGGGKKTVSDFLASDWNPARKNFSQQTPPVFLRYEDASGVLYRNRIFLMNPEYDSSRNVLEFDLFEFNQPLLAPGNYEKARLFFH